MKKIVNSTIFKLLYKIIKWIIFIILILYVFFVGIQRFCKSDILGFRMYTVSSNSMFPKYKVNDVIVIKEVPKDKLKVNDVVTYKGEAGDLKGLTITHRIIKIDTNNLGKEIFTTKGDANKISDPTIQYPQIIGKVVYKTKIFSFITNLIRNQYFFFFAVFIPLVLVIFLEITDSISDFRKNKKRK